MCITRMAAAAGFMVSAAGNRDRAWGQACVWKWGGDLLSFGGPVAVMLGVKVMSGKALDC